MTDSSIQLRPYQIQAVRATHAALRQHQRAILCLPTGSGKRLAAVWWANQIVAKGRKLLVVTDRRTLIRQMQDEMARCQIPCGLIMADEEETPDAPVKIATLQTLQRRKYRTVPGCDWIIHDEAHRMPDAIKEVFSRSPQAKAVGLTATPVGPQGYSLIGIYDTIVEGARNSELIELGYLLPTVIFAPSEPDVDGVVLSTDKVPVTSSGEYNQQELERLVENCTVFADLFREWAPYSALQTIVFPPRVRFAYGLAKQFQERGHSAEVIEAGTPERERKQLIDAFANRELRILVSVDVLTCGFDQPIAQCGIDLQPNKQLRSYWQKLGRVKRPFPGQNRAIWLDFAGNYWRFPHPDEDPDWAEATAEQSIQDVVRQKRESEAGEREPWRCPKCGHAPSRNTVRDGKCPNCGTPIRKPIRCIRTSDGRLMRMSPKRKATVQKSREQNEWDKWRWIAFNKHETLDWARVMYHSKLGRWPDESLRYCPSATSGDWKRTVSAVFPWMAKRGRKTAESEVSPRGETGE